MEDEVFGQKRLIQRSGLPKGLLLELISGEDVEVFRRVGIFAFRDVEDLRVEKEEREGGVFRERVEEEKRTFFENCDRSVVRIV